MPTAESAGTQTTALSGRSTSLPCQRARTTSTIHGTKTGPSGPRHAQAAHWPQASSTSPYRTRIQTRLSGVSSLSAGDTGSGSVIGCPHPPPGPPPGRVAARGEAALPEAGAREEAGTPQSSATEAEAREAGTPQSSTTWTSATRAPSNPLQSSGSGSSSQWWGGGRYWSSGSGDGTPCGSSS